jgi:hypothetical protein
MYIVQLDMADMPWPPIWGFHVQLRFCRICAFHSGLVTSGIC